MPHTPSSASRPSPGPLPARVREAVEALHAVLSRELARSLDEALDAAHRELFRLSERSTAPVLQVHWLRNLQRLVDHRYRLSPALLAELRSALESIRDPACEPGPPGVPRVVTRAEGMRLVEDTGPDETAMLDELGRRQEARAGLPLLLLGQRLGVLAAAPAFAAHALPVGPRALAEAFMRAADELGLDTDARKVLLQAFDREVVSGYPALAEAMNSTLDRAGVLPGLSFVPLRPRPVGRPAVRGGDRDGAGDDRDTGPGGEAAAGEPFAGESLDTPPSTDAAPLPPPQPRLQDAQRLAQLRQWLAERRALLTRLSGSGGVPGPVMGAMELDNVLAALQVGPAVLRSSAGLRQAVHEQAGRLGGTAGLDDADADSLALFSSLYTRLQESTDPRVHELLAALQLPLLRLAVRDPGFLVQQAAPARTLLATVVETGAGHHGPDGIDPQLLPRMQEVVRELSLQYPHDGDVFERANTALAEPLQAALRRAEIAERRHVEAARGRERLLSARRHAAAAVDWALAGGQPPRFQRRLLDQAWTDALALVALRHGTGSAQWHEHIETTAAIARAIARTGDDGSVADPVHTARVRDALGLVGYHPEQAQAIADHLTGQAATDGDPASRTELVIGMKERNRLGGNDDPGPGGQADPLAPARAHPGELQWLARLELLPPGQWIGFDAADRPGGARHLRLAWHGEDSGRVLLLGVRGHPPADPPVATLRGLARLLANGKARLLGDSPDELFDQAWRGMIDALVSQSPGPDAADSTGSRR